MVTHDGNDATPSQAGIYAALQDDPETYVESRRLAEMIKRAAENGPQLAADNRAWVLRVTEHIARHGISQIIDLGCGMPATPNVHDVAQAVDPAARVVYVDNDDQVLAHGRSVLEAAGTVYKHADIADVTDVMAAVRGHLDLAQPTAIILGSVLQLVRHDDPTALVAQYVSALAPGSLLAISHVASEGGVTPEQQDVINQAYAGHLTVRNFEGVYALFGGLVLVQPGLVDAHDWPEKDPRGREKTALRMLAGVAKV